MRVKVFFVGKSEGNRPLGKLRHRWEDNIKKDLQEVGCGSVDWFELAQDRDRWQVLVNAVVNLLVWTGVLTAIRSRTVQPVVSRYID